MSRSQFRIVVSLCFLIAAFDLLYPVYVIRPFRHQGQVELQVALWVLRYRMVPELLMSLVAMAALWMSWPARKSKVARVAGVTGTLAVVACALLSRVNVYEQMFHPLATPAFESAGQTRLDGSEKVLSVRLGEESRAYPIRSISYHHIVNDFVAGVPIAATY